MGLIKEYLDVVRDQTGMRGIYPPQMAVKLGDYGPVKDGRFVASGNISTFTSTKFTETQSPGSMSREFKSKGVSKVLIGAGASVNGQAASAKARMELDFASEFSVYCSVAGCTHKRISDVTSVGEEILELYRAKAWREEWAVVTEVMTSANTTVVVAREKNSKMVLEASGNVPAINMSDPSVVLSVVFDSTSSEQWITEKSQSGLTPFCFLMKIDDPLFGGPEFEPFSLVAKKKGGAKVKASETARFIPYGATADLAEWRIDGARSTKGRRK